jgi:hypothetical protein
MFIREKSKTVKGKKYIQHQLIESFRTPTGPRQRLVLNLGFLDLHPDKWKELANTIESEIHKQPRLFVTDAQIEKLAKHYARVIVREKLNKESERAASDNGQNRLIADYQSVDVNSVSSSEARKIGAEHVVLAQMREYKFDKMLKEQRLSQAAREIFGLKETIILYDLTNTYFEGSKKGSKIPQADRMHVGCRRGREKMC